MDLQDSRDFSTWQYDHGKGFIQGYFNRIDEGYPIIHFLHGNGFSVGTYRQFLTGLSGFNLIMQDAAGHGMSTLDYKFIGWNKTSERFLDSLRSHRHLDGRERVIGVGHSFGGCMTALMSASAPDLFNQLVLLDPAIFPPRLLLIMRGVKLMGLKGQIPLVKKARRRRTHWDTLAQVKSNFTERGVFKGWEESCLDDYIASSIRESEKGGYTLSCPTWMEASIFASYPKGLWKAIKQISVPTYILQGKNTFEHFKEAYSLAAQLNPNIKVIEVEGGHCFMQQYPSISAETVMKIINGKAV